MNNLQRGALLGLLLGSLALITCEAVWAQSLADCSSLDHTAGPKVVIDQLVYHTESGQTKLLSNEQDMMLEIMMTLQSKFQNLFPDKQPKPVFCADRKPKADGTDFVPNLVKVLNGRHVLLEIWGTIKSGKMDGKSLVGGSIFMMIIPVRYYTDEEQQLDFHFLSFPQQERGDYKTATVAITFGTEFDVYSSIAHGIKALKNKSYDDAKKYLANARLQWKKALDTGGLARTATDHKKILDYIKALEKNTVSAAAADPNYKGDLVAVEDVLEERGG